MAAIRKSGGVVAFHWQGKIPDPQQEPFCAALAERRFRTIENAASEEVSIGWVTATLPTGDDFELDALDAGAGTWLRMRIDKKTLPRKWLMIHLETEERARGKKLSPRERRELKQDLGEKLLPRVLPTVNLVDALLFRDRKTVLLFATSRSVNEAFAKLFFETFAVPLDRANPYQLALRAGLDREALAALDRLEPVRWPDSTEAPGRAPRPMRAASPAAMAAGGEREEGEA
ncbi:MAG: recombination-associated protein RdgC [Planctomycetota bacterium]